MGTYGATASSKSRNSVSDTEGYKMKQALVTTIISSMLTSCAHGTPKEKGIEPKTGERDSRLPVLGPVAKA